MPRSHRERAGHRFRTPKRYRFPSPRIPRRAAWLDHTIRAVGGMTGALGHMYEGRLMSTAGLDSGIEEFENHFQEHQEPHSTALYSLLEGKPYLVGPLARLNLNLDRLPEPAAQALKKSGIPFPSQNMFHSIVTRAVEIYLAMLEAIRLLENYRPEEPHVPVHIRAGTGIGCTEAPAAFSGIVMKWIKAVESARPGSCRSRARIRRASRKTFIGRCRRLVWVGAMMTCGCSGKRSFAMLKAFPDGSVSIRQCDRPGS